MYTVHNLYVRVYRDCDQLFWIQCENLSDLLRELVRFGLLEQISEM